MTRGWKTKCKGAENVKLTMSQQCFNESTDTSGATSAAQHPGVWTMREASINEADWSRWIQMTDESDLTKTHFYFQPDKQEVM